MELKALAKKIVEAHAGVQESNRRAVERAQIAGRLLTKAKNAIGHGNWAGWVKQHCGFSLRTAQVYMRLARLSKADAQRVAHLPLREAVRTVAAPKEATIRETYQVLVMCKEESEQTTLLERLTQEGFQCRALMS